MPTASCAEIVTEGGVLPSSTSVGSNVGFSRQPPLRSTVTMSVVALLDSQRPQATGQTSATALPCTCVQFHGHKSKVRG